MDVHLLPSVWFIQLLFLLDESPGETLPTGVALPTGMALPTGARDQDEPNRKNPAGKAKGKAKKSDSSQPTDNDLEVIQQFAETSEMYFDTKHTAAEKNRRPF